MMNSDKKLDDDYVYKVEKPSWEKDF